MTQNNSLSVRNDAEIADNNTRIPTFEEVYAMPYVQESINSIIDENVHKYPILEGHEDDLRQEILISIWKCLPGFAEERSSLKTFLRLIMETSIIKARRYYFTETNLSLTYAADIHDLERDEDEESEISRNTRADFANAALKNTEKAMLEKDVQEILTTLPPKIQKTAELIMAGHSLHEIARMYGIEYSSFQYTYLRPLREAFRKKY